jgi:hypothetical protein
MLRDQKNIVAPAYLIMFLLVVNLLAGCSGCSKSGRKIPANNDKIGLINSENDNLNNPQTTGNDTISTAYEIDNKNNTIISTGDYVYGIVYSIITAFKCRLPSKGPIKFSNVLKNVL